MSIWCLVELLSSDFVSSVRPATSVIVNLLPEDGNVRVSMVNEEFCRIGIEEQIEGGGKFW